MVICGRKPGCIRKPTRKLELLEMDKREKQVKGIGKTRLNIKASGKGDRRTLKRLFNMLPTQVRTTIITKGSEN